MVGVAVLGYLSGLIGFLIGAVLSAFANSKDRRFHGTLMGFTGGLLIAFVCFELLPHAFDVGGLYFGVLGILAGVCVIAFIDGNFVIGKDFQHSPGNSKFLKTGAFLALGIALHKIPEGIAIGSLLYVTLESGIRLGIILAVHCIPEGLAVCVPLKEFGMRPSKLIAASFLMALPMGIGCFIGYTLGQIFVRLVAFSLSFSGGIMLYITCGEILPESKEIWNGRLVTIGAAFGFVLGILLTSKL